MKKIKFHKGFTLIEIIVVIVVIGILATISVISYSGWKKTTTETQIKNDLNNVVTAMNDYMNFNNEYPTTLPSSFKASSGVNVSLVSSEDGGYCINGNSSDGSIKYYVDSDTKTPTEGSCVTGFTSINSDYTLNCSIYIGNAYCWGTGTWGALGNNSTTSSYVPTAVSTSGVLSGKTIKAVNTGGAQRACVIASDDQAYCWGHNDYGQLGNNSTTDSLVPVAVYNSGVLSGKTIKAISGSNYNFCAIASDDQIYCWGDNRFGQLGNNSTTNSSVPVAVDTSGVLSGKTIKSISVGKYYACAIASDNQVYCWGYNSYGQLGSGNTSEKHVPVAVVTSGVLSGMTVKNISASAGQSHTCAIASDNQVYCWGYNNSGQLGNNSTTNSSVPVVVNTSGVLSGKTIKSISINYFSSCVIASDSQSYCWGLNNYGQLGNGSTTNSLVPVAVNTAGLLDGKTIKAINPGYYHTCAIASDKQAYCWGYNHFGTLGNGTTTDSLTPVKVTTP